MRCCQLILAPRCISFPFPAVLEIARRKLEEVKEIEFPIITPLYPSSSPSPSYSRGSENLRYIIVVFVIAFVPERRRSEGKERKGRRATKKCLDFWGNCEWPRGIPPKLASLSLRLLHLFNAAAFGFGFAVATACGRSLTLTSMALSVKVVLLLL